MCRYGISLSVQGVVAGLCLVLVLLGDLDHTSSCRVIIVILFHGHTAIAVVLVAAALLLDCHQGCQRPLQPTLLLVNSLVGIQLLLLDDRYTAAAGFIFILLSDLLQSAASIVVVVFVLVLAHWHR